MADPGDPNFIDTDREPAAIARGQFGIADIRDQVAEGIDRFDLADQRPADPARLACRQFDESRRVKCRTEFTDIPSAAPMGGASRGEITTLKRVRDGLSAPAVG